MCQTPWNTISQIEDLIWAHLFKSLHASLFKAPFKHVCNTKYVFLVHWQQVLVSVFAYEFFLVVQKYIALYKIPSSNKIYFFLNNNLIQGRRRSKGGGPPSEVFFSYIQGRDLLGCGCAPEQPSLCPCQQRSEERGKSSDHAMLLSSNR